MTKADLLAVAICAVLSVAVVIGSTGWGYADYRPLRDYDIFALTLSWAGLAFYLVKGRRRA